MNDILREIVARTRSRLASEPMDVEDVRRDARHRASTRAPFQFSNALRGSGPRIIAELKAASPSAGSIVDDLDSRVEAVAGAYRAGGAAALSVVTEPEFFRGSQSWLQRAGDASGLPVIMKDFVVEPSQLVAGVAAGADAVLLLASLLDAATIARFIARLDDFGVDALVEVHDEEELARAIEGGARLIGVNSRDLRTFHVDLATAERLAPSIPAGAVRVAESGIRTPADIARLARAGFHAFLVGESLLRQSDHAVAVRSLLAEENVRR